MLKRIVILSVFAVCGCLSARSQSSPIDSIKTKYVDWLTGNGLDYSVYEVGQRYTRFYSAGVAAKNLAGYDFANPGPVWNLALGADRSAYATLVEQKLIRLVFLYKLTGPPANPNPNYHSVTLRDTILGIFDYLKAKDIGGGTDFNMEEVPAEESVHINNSVALRSSAYATSILLMKDELVAAGEFTHHMAALENLTSFIDPDNSVFNFTYPGFNTDVVRATVQQRFCYVLAQDNTVPTRVADMQFLKNFIDNALKIGYGWADCIKPDYLTYHHRGAYANSYGVDALNVAAILNLMLQGSPYELSAEAKLNLKNALMNYRKFCTDYEMPRGLAGRFPLNTASFDNIRLSLGYMYLSDTAANKDAGREFMRLWGISVPNNTNLIRAAVNSITLVHGLGGANDIRRVLNANPEPSQDLKGHFGLPYGGLSVHKHQNYQASAKGTGKHIWDFEMSAAENVFGRYSSAGSLELLTNGTRRNYDSSGLSLTGWDWAHFPGTTATYLPYTSLATGGSRNMTDRDFLAHASLDSSGIFALDYVDVYSPTRMSALKSMFFFGDKILCLGSRIRDVGGTAPLHTTLFQTALFDSSKVSHVNGNAVAGASYTYSQTGGAFWATDAVGNGFVVPAGTVNVDSITVKRMMQNSRNQANTADASGRFASAYVNHGKAPVNAGYRYAVVLQGKQAGTQQLAANFSSYFMVLRQDSMAHAVKHIPDSVYGYVFFDTSAVFTDDVVRRVDKQSIVMTQKLDGGNRIKVSLTNPNLGLLARGEHYTWSQISSTIPILNRVPQADVVTLTLAGTWEAEAPANGIALTHQGGDTRVSFTTISGLTVQTVLKKIQPPAAGYTGCGSYVEGNTVTFTNTSTGNPTGYLWGVSPATGWAFAGGTNATSQNPQVTFTAAGTYAVSLTAGYTGGGDTETVANCVVVFSNAGIADNGLAGETVLYPNPTEGMVTLYIGHAPPYGNLRVTVYDAVGQRLHTVSENISSPVGLDLSAYGPGIYFVEIRSGGGVATKRVVVSR